MSGAFILVVLQVVAMGNFNHSNSPRHEVYGWQPIGVFATSDACVQASKQLAAASGLVAHELEPKASGVRGFRCLATGGGNG